MTNSNRKEVISKETSFSSSSCDDELKCKISNISYISNISSNRNNSSIDNDSYEFIIKDNQTNTRSYNDLESKASDYGKSPVQSACHSDTPSIRKIDNDKTGKKFVNEKIGNSGSRKKKNWNDSMDVKEIIQSVSLTDKKRDNTDSSDLVGMGRKARERERNPNKAFYYDLNKRKIEATKKTPNLLKRKFYNKPTEKTGGRK